MIHSHARTVFLCASLLALAAGAPRADTGLTGAPILNRPVGARSSGMGRAFTAVPGDAESLMYNPAGLAFVTDRRAYAAYMNGFGGGAYGFAALPVKAAAFVLTPALLYYNSGTVDLNIGGADAGSVTAELDKVYMLSAAFRPLPGLALGATVKRTSIELAEAASASAVHYDLGLLYAPGKGLSFGAAALNNGGAIKFEEKGDPAPAALRAGLLYKFVVDPPDQLDSSADVSYLDLVFATDWSRIIREKGYYQSGLEMNMQIRNSVFLSVRAGYLFSRGEEGFTMGFGVKQGPWDFGFAYETAKKLEARHPVSLSYGF